jgi:hypothetical protein
MIEIKVNEQDKQRLFNALSRIRQTIETQGKDTMQMKCAVDYYQLVMKNIQKKARVSPAYSKRYRNWKYEYGWMGYPSPWRLRGDLVKSLGAYRFGDGYIGGVQPGARDSGGKSWFGKGKQGPKGPPKSIEMYGRVEEHRRPIFEPTMNEYAKDGWKKRGDEMLKRLQADWR